MTAPAAPTLSRTTMPNQTPFRNAWEDLYFRIEGAIRNLTELHDDLPFASVAENDTIASRYKGKIVGLLEARSIWGDLDMDARRTTDYAGAWRAFTHEIKALHADPAERQNVRSGLALAISYQTGYGPDVDATQIQYSAGC